MRTTMHLQWLVLIASALPLQAQETSVKDAPAQIVDAGTLLVFANGQLKGDENYEIARRRLGKKHNPEGSMRRMVEK